MCVSDALKPSYCLRCGVIRGSGPFGIVITPYFYDFGFGVNVFKSWHSLAVVRHCTCYAIKCVHVIYLKFDGSNLWLLILFPVRSHIFCFVDPGGANRIAQACTAVDCNYRSTTQCWIYFAETIITFHNCGH